MLPSWWNWKKNEYKRYLAADKQILYRAASYDYFIIEELWKHNEYFLDQLKLPNDGAIIDIGAHIGAFALRADSLFPQRPILAFEPIEDNYKLLKKNISINKNHNIIPIQAAINSSGNYLNIYLDNKNTAGHSSIYQTDNQLVTVQASQLEKILLTYHVHKIALLKIDCEGSEYDILYHLKPELFKIIDCLALEYHPVEQYDFQALKGYLHANGLYMIHHKTGYFPGQGTALFTHVNQH